MSLLTSLINFVIHALASNRKYYTLTHQQCSLTVEIIEWVKVLRSVQVLWQMRIYYLLAHTYLILLLGHNKMLHWLWTLDSAVFHFVWIYFKNFFTFDHLHCKQTLPRSQGYIWPTVECRKPPVNKENYIQLFIPIF